jgi:Ca-activated chloride channel family protein
MTFGEITFLKMAAWWWVPLAVGIAILLRTLRRRRYVASTAVRFLRARHYRASIVRRLPWAVLVLAAVAVALSVMEPVLPYSEQQVYSRGLDIFLVLDLSSSMQEIMDSEGAAVRAVAPPTFSSTMGVRPRPAGKTRLDTTKDALRDFIRRRRDDRLGLIVFSDNAYLVSPMTFDREYLLSYVDMVDDQILRGEGMTAIGDGITLANYVMERQSPPQGRRNRVVVVFTDGENNHGRSPVEALVESAEMNIRVHVIGVDIDEEVKVKPMVVQLINAVRQQGGRYYDADTVSELQAANDELDTLEKVFLASKVSTRNAPVYHWFAIPGMVLLALALALRALPYFVDLT